MTVLDQERILKPFEGLSENDKRLLLAKRLEQLRRRAPTNLRASAQFIHRTDDDLPLVTARHHSIWVRILEDRKRFPFVALVVPPGYGKSTWVSQAYATWRIGATNGKVRLGMIANTDNLSWAWAAAVRDAIEGERFQMAFPNCVPNRKRGWRHNELFFEATPHGNTGTLYAAGMNGQVQSKRFDEILIDDPTTWQDALSRSKVERQARWLQNTLMRRFPPGMRPPNGGAAGGRCVVTCTRWSVNDLIPTFKELGFVVVTMPALGFWDGHRDRNGEFVPGVEPLWPEKEDRDELEQRRDENPIDFELVDQGNPKVLAGDVFDAAWFKYRPPIPRDDYVRVVMALDTASGKDRARGDYFAACTMGLRADNSIDIINIYRGILTAPEQENETLKLLTMYQPDLLVIEDAREGTALWQRLVSLHINQAMKPVVPVQDKEFRASPMAQAYRLGQIYHAAHVDSNKELRPEKWVRVYQGELEGFPSGTHDDMVDAAAHCYSEIGTYGPRARVL